MRSKRYRALPQQAKKLDANSIENLIKLVKKNCTAKFNESIDVNFKLNTKQKKNEANIRTVLNLPVGINKKIRVAVLCEEEKIDEAKKSGADLFGPENIINEISQGEINFDKLICSPNMMIKLSKFGKILGPKGLMPNPKLGTVTNEISKAVKNIKSGQIELKNDKDGNASLSIGRKDFSDENLIKNFNATIDIITREKPTSVKGNWIKNAFLTSTMGISYRLKLTKKV